MGLVRVDGVDGCRSLRAGQKKSLVFLKKFLLSPCTFLALENAFEKLLISLATH